jgi:hypothetical protein
MAFFVAGNPLNTCRISLVGWLENLANAFLFIPLHPQIEAGCELRYKALISRSMRHGGRRSEGQIW